MGIFGGYLKQKKIRSVMKKDSEKQKMKNKTFPVES